MNPTPPDKPVSDEIAEARKRTDKLLRVRLNGTLMRAVDTERSLADARIAALVAVVGNLRDQLATISGWAGQGYGSEDRKEKRECFEKIRDRADALMENSEPFDERQRIIDKANEMIHSIRRFAGECDDVAKASADSVRAKCAEEVRDRLAKIAFEYHPPALPPTRERSG